MIQWKSTEVLDSTPLIIQESEPLGEDVMAVVECSIISGWAAYVARSDGLRYPVLTSERSHRFASAGAAEAAAAAAALMVAQGGWPAPGDLPQEVPYRDGNTDSHCHLAP